MAERLRIGLLAPDLGVGGTQRVVQSLACSLPQDVTELTAIGIRGGPREKAIRAAGVDVEVCDGNFATLREVLVRRRIEVLHVNRHGYTQPEPLEAAAAAGTPAIVETNVFGLLDRSPSSRLIDLRVFVSHTCKDRYVHWLGNHPDPAAKAVIYNPVEVARWQQSGNERRQAFRAAHGVSAETVLFGFVSQKMRWDRDLLMRRVAPFVRRLDSNPRAWRLACVGMPDPMRAICEKDSVLDRRILPLSEMSDDDSLAAAYQGMDVYVHLSQLGEACPTVIQEAMACGRPVIVRYVPLALNNGQCEIVDHGETGCVVGGGIDEMARSAAELLEQPALLAQYGAAAQAKAWRAFDSAVTARQYLAIFVEALARKHPDRELPSALEELRPLSVDLLAQDGSAASAWGDVRLARCQYGISPWQRLLVRGGLSPWLFRAKNLIKSLAAAPRRLRRH